LSGRQPFRGDTPTDTLANILQREPEPLNFAALPPDLDQIVGKMLAKDLEARYSTVADVVADLKALQKRIEFEAELRRTPLPDMRTEAQTQMIQSAKRLSALPVDSGAARADEGFWVAVLPFKHRGGGSDLEALAEGLSEEIVTGLSRFSYLKVIARSSTLGFTESTDIRSVGKQLGARYVMEGSLRQAGSVLRVTVQLIDTSTGAHLWAETYNCTFRAEAVFELQDDLVPRIVSTVADWYGVLPHSMSETVRLKPPDQLTPYEALLRSFGYFERIAAEEHAIVRSSLQRAVAQEPGNADGWAMLSMMYGEEHRFGFNVEPDSLGRSLEAARHAVDVAHANHFAWLALAQALFFRKEFDPFQDAAERAIVLNSMDGSTVEYLGHLIAFSGNWERGCELAERGRRLNPNHPSWYWSVPFLDAYRKGDYRGARPFLLKGNPQKNWLMQALLAAVHGQLGESEAAARPLREVLMMRPDFQLIAHDEFAKWYLPELVDHLMDGLRKAGLETAGQEIPSAFPSGSNPANVSRADEAFTAGLTSSELSVQNGVAKPGSARATKAKSSTHNPKSRLWLIPILGLLVLVGGILAYHYLPTRGKQIESIAVMPFVNEGGNKDVEYLSDGMTETLISSLSQLPNLNVKARSSVFRYKGKETDAKTIGKALNVQAILNGRVVQRGDQVTLSLELVDVATENAIWSQQYNRTQTDLVTLQSEIARAVSSRLKSKLSGADVAKVEKTYTTNPEAYQLYLKGRFYWNKRTGESLRQAVEFYNQAIERDQNYALAYSGLAETYVLYSFYGIASPKASMPQAKAAALRAVEIDDSVAEAHSALGNYLLFFEFDRAGGEKELRRAIELNPNYATAHHWLGLNLLTVLKRFDEAISEMKRAEELDPLSPVISADAGLALVYARRYDEAIAQTKRALSLDPNFFSARYTLGYAYDGKRLYTEAIAEYRRALALNDDPYVKALLVSSMVKSGRQADALKLVKELKAESATLYVPNYCLAMAYTALGGKEEAFGLLEKDIAEHSSFVSVLAVEPAFDDLRNDPRFKAMLRRLNLPE
jgi:TolB-like protein/Flp pilus assembly protein TadD